MQLIIDAKKLSKGLSAIKQAIGKDPVILSCVLLSVGEFRVEFKAFNGVIGITHSLLCDVVEGAGTEIAVPYALFSTLVSKLDGIIDLNLRSELGEETSPKARASLKESILEIKTDSSTFNLNLMDAEEFPNLPVLDKVGVVMDWVEAEGILKSVAAIASDEISKQILTGVCLKQVDGRTELVATDSNRLVVRKLDEDLTAETTTIPKELVNAAIAALKGQSEVQFSREGNLVKFTSEQTKIIGFTIQGDYPKYQQLIPSKCKQAVEVDVNSLLGAINLVSPIANDNQLVTLKLSGDKIELTATSGLGTANAEILAAQIEEDLEIAFNIKYLVSGLISLSGRVQIRFNSWNQPAIISSDNYTYLIMPVQVRK